MRRSWVFAAATALAAATATLAPGGQQFPVPPPPLSEDYYPCAENCHNDLRTDTTPRVLTDEHTDIDFHHAEQFRWCLDCHDAQDRNQLHLQSGERLGFEESHRLCGQCHGDKYRDWREGIHGKRTGHWNGEKQYLLCAHCHNPHRPKFQDLKPEPPPEVPGSKTLKSHSAAKAH